jgi:catechol 2,3-dioxygenase-like lactoylglutathione lyase family enzyme
MTEDVDAGVGDGAGTRCDGPWTDSRSATRPVRPVWPNTPGEQQMMLHLDFEVSDLAAATAYALEHGAVLADLQPQEDVRVFYDPDGHPFCLYAHGG